MVANINVEDVIEVRKAGMKALSAALGYDGAQAFLNLAFGGKGDYTKEKYDLPEPSLEEAFAEMARIDAAGEA